MITNKNILEKCKEWKRSSQTVVFTNGCFDLLHKGHLDLLNKASTFGDVLVIGLNSDESVKSLKGDNRPIESQEERTRNLMKLEIVNDVFVFSPETPIDLIKLIKPDYLVKGGDYKDKDIVGSDEMLKWGGEVKIVNLTPGFSTTSTIEKKRRENLF